MINVKGKWALITGASGVSIETAEYESLGYEEALAVLAGDAQMREEVMQETASHEGALQETAPQTGGYHFAVLKEDELLTAYDEKRCIAWVPIEPFENILDQCK